MLFLRLITLLITFLLLGGCVTLPPVSEQLPTPNYKAALPVAFGIIDDREYVADGGYPSSYIGTTIHAYGIRIPRNVYPYITEDDRDENASLPTFLLDRLEKGLLRAGWSPLIVQMNHVPDAKAAAAIALSSKVSRVLVINIKEWRSRHDGHMGSRFDFNTDYTVTVFKADGSISLSKRMGKDNYLNLSVLAERHPEATSIRNAVLMLTRNELTKMMNDPEVRAAITD